MTTKILIQLQELQHMNMIANNEEGIKEYIHLRNKYSLIKNLNEQNRILIPVQNKVPQTKGWNKWKGQSQKTVDHYFKKQFKYSNVGLRLDGLTVVDADDSETLAKAEELFGTTPLISRTPRQGGHLYYRYKGETCDNVKLRNKGLNIDIKATKNAYVVEIGQDYYVEKGSFEQDLKRLPYIAKGSPIDLYGLKPNISDSRTLNNLNGNVSIEGKESIVGRNTTLFNHLRNFVGHSPSCTEVEARKEAYQFNQSFDEPLYYYEVDKTIQSVMNYKNQGTLFVSGQKAKVQMDMNSWEKIGDDNARLLYMYLRLNHSARPNFRICGHKMVKSGNGLSWKDREKYAKATEHLIKTGMIKRIFKGGGRNKDGTYQASLYVFPTQYNKDTL